MAHFTDVLPRTPSPKRILVLGMCPLPTENENQTLGPGIRTWQFIKPLLENGYSVCLVSCRHSAAFEHTRKLPVEALSQEGFIHYMVSQKVFEEPTWIQAIHDHFQPDCVIGATVFPSYIACKLETDKPIWADLFGHIMAEAQVKCQVFNDDFYIHHFWRYESRILERADAFSVVSTPQMYATLGELGARGRLNRFTVDFPFVRVIPCAMQFYHRYDEKQSTLRLRGTEFKSDAFVVLWSGGYNTWADIDTLFRALEQAMSENEHIVFVSTGGEIGGHDEITYPRFLQLIKNSQFKDRFIMKGWIPHEQVYQYWLEADIAVNSDKIAYEALLGSRNRILDWMGVGLPVLTSRLCELTEIIEKEQLGLTFTPEKHEELKRLILWAAEHRDSLQELAVNAKAYALRYFSINETTRPLIEWATNPVLSPDQNRIAPLTLDMKHPRYTLRGHYWATFRNQLGTQGIANTMRWLIRRSLGSPR